ncbi:MAG: hypothetical protein A2W91_18220 [Bacteroidetes bacterium GWF2_38_335]|nr:MAG: hypothetical protein A2W91_18220 [Bacteroidetes bacterium GWF2_38_335]OFY80098.1 MAG: hypothetical protein A2281_12420 [Bacteroidetes bacterium RIFOXYA12_FULL_38_20]HBS88576.1 hypothetical protein [Bacteroidales bacterium]
MKKALKIAVLSLNILALVSLLFSYLSVYVSPASFWPFAFFGLFYPVIFIVNLCFLVFWIIRKKYIYAAVIGFLVIIGWNFIFRTFQIDFTGTRERTPETLKVMSYNVRLFCLYDWKDNYQKRDMIIEYFLEEDPDILCLQEFYYEDNPEFETLDTLIKVLKAKNYHTYDAAVLWDNYHFGVATLSSYPIVNKGHIHFDNTSNCSIFTDIVFRGDTIRIYNNHLESIRFKEAEYNQIDSLTESFDEDKYNGIIQKLKHSYSIRAKQAEIVSEHIAKSPYPVIVCGDFNDTPVSYVYRKMKAGLNDAFRKSGAGMGTTYNGKIPFQRIDYILYGDEFKSSNYTTGDISLSDHYPIHCLIELDE